MSDAVVTPTKSGRQRSISTPERVKAPASGGTTVDDLLVKEFLIKFSRNVRALRELVDAVGTDSDGADLRGRISSAVAATAQANRLIDAELAVRTAPEKHIERYQQNVERFEALKITARVRFQENPLPRAAEQPPPAQTPHSPLLVGPQAGDAGASTPGQRSLLTRATIDVAPSARSDATRTRSASQPRSQTPQASSTTKSSKQASASKPRRASSAAEASPLLRGSVDRPVTTTIQHGSGRMPTLVSQPARSTAPINEDEHDAPLLRGADLETGRQQRHTSTRARCCQWPHALIWLPLIVAICAAILIALYFILTKAYHYKIPL
eukprot:TRINITY_DN30979_c0_g1_i1.p1 TRINITY_DN30979_c0_g1~~TRINITY_DN30979_c0_g1_i1.p1  ORF type:complete len:324 (-),score=109.79 TRINITY_DN30979_c0_g1_i1:376-1347(-)